MPEASGTNRIIQVLDRLGIEEAHLAGGAANDWAELVSAHSARISTLTAVTPPFIDLSVFRRVLSRSLVITGDQPPIGSRIIESLGQVPEVRRVVLKGATNLVWADPIADHLEAVSTSLLAFLESKPCGDRNYSSELAGVQSGEVAEVSFELCGSGKPLVLLPIGFAPTQWDALLPLLRQRFMTVLLGGMHVGMVQVLEGRARSDGHRRLLRDVVHELHLEAGESILDVGCGSGGVTRWLARHTSGQNPIVGIDINRFLIREATGLMRKEGLDAAGIRFQEGDALRLPFPSESFDITFSTTVMEEIDAAVMLSEMVRVTKPGGRVCVVVRARDLPYSTGLTLRPELKAKCESIFPGGVSSVGCADSSLYRRFADGGLVNVCALPSWSVFRDPAGSVETGLRGNVLASLTAEEGDEWCAAAERAVRAGTFFLSWPHHCAVGTKPRA